MVTWPVAYAEESPGCSAYAALTPEQIEQFEEMAVQYLWNWTSRAFGTVEVTIRPCRGTALRTSTFWGWRAGEPVPWSCGVCGPPCDCSLGNWAYRLPSHATKIVEVMLDGEVFTDWRLSPDGYQLIRTDGGLWPRVQNLNAWVTQEDTWQVTYLAGREVPVGGQLAAGLLACELAKSFLGDNTCALPKRFSAITRQGVTVAALDTFEDIDTGHTGIWAIDAWVASIMKVPHRSRVYSPDVPRSRT